MPSNGETAFVSSPTSLSVEISLPLLKKSLSASPFSISSSQSKSNSTSYNQDKKRRLLHGVLVMKNNVSIN